ncbi:cyclophilin-like fold protein [Rhodococcus sp. NM-2]|uniref:cyclophilin-like fold protein n=1 Tax=Rhodococcus sp. NM-2 TaxID=3401174 RepID=UPI003AB06359
MTPRILDTTASHDAVRTTVRFTAGDTSIHVTMADNPAAQDFLSMLPLTLEFEDFAGNEKISYLPRELDHEETEGSILNQGDFLYYIPWGNVGFWYTTDPGTHAADSVVLGSYAASLDDLQYLEGRDVTVEALP